MFTFFDRVGNQEELACIPGETIFQVLVKHFIPPTSVIVLQDNYPVSDAHKIASDACYEAHLIEGYDIETIRSLQKNMTSDDPKDTVYLKRRLSFEQSGSLNSENVPLSLEETANYLEDMIRDTCTQFELISKNDGVLVGLSGGVDSSSLLLALAAVRDHLPAFRLAAVTFEDYDSQNSPTFTHARELALHLNIEHHVAPATVAEEVFHLNRPLREIFPQLMETNAAHFVMYIDHHTTRRALEVFAEQQGLNKIALGLHTTDLIAGLLNGWMTGYNVASLPLRQLGNITYVYPLAFIAKRELHLYHFYRTHKYAKHSHPNDWELNPKDRNFYYYLADQLQTYWPSLEVMLFTAHHMRLRRQDPIRYEECTNCGSKLVHQPFTMVEGGECDACVVFRKFGFID